VQRSTPGTMPGRQARANQVMEIVTAATLVSMTASVAAPATPVVAEPAASACPVGPFERVKGVDDYFGRQPI